MSTTHSIKAEPRHRTGSGALKLMRREGFIPSVIYGTGAENRNVKVSSKAFKDMLAHSASANVLVELEMDGGNQLAFLQDIQNDPLTGTVLHADFLAVKDDTEITAQIPVDLDGEPVGVKMGGQLEQLLYNVEIKCLPKDLPELIRADISTLKVGEHFTIGDVEWPEGVRPTVNDDVVVASVHSKLKMDAKDMTDDRLYKNPNHSSIFVAIASLFEHNRA